VAVVTKPFPFEGKKRTDFAEQGIEELSKYVDSLITIPNEKLLKVMGKGTPLLQAFSAANDILSGAVQGIAELITRPGLINVDFADVRTVMSEMGTAMMGHGSATGEDRAEEASESAIACPLLEDIDLSGARGILVNITAGPDFSIHEFETVGNAIKAFASENATVVVGTVIDMEMSDELRVTVVATGIGAEKKPDISLVSNRANKVIADSNEFKLQANGSHMMPSASTMPEAAKTIVNEEKAEQGNDLEYLDIPAFLRKQAD
jgi:cell division protein FtsZ